MVTFRYITRNSGHLSSLEEEPTERLVAFNCLISVYMLTLCACVFSTLIPIFQCVSTSSSIICVFHYTIQVIWLFICIDKVIYRVQCILQALKKFILIPITINPFTIVLQCAVIFGCSSSLPLSVQCHISSFHSALTFYMCSFVVHSNIVPPLLVTITLINSLL